MGEDDVREQKEEERTAERVVIVDVRLPFRTYVKLTFNVFCALGLLYWAVRLYEKAADTLLPMLLALIAAQFSRH